MTNRRNFLKSMGGLSTAAAVGLSGCLNIPGVGGGESCPTPIGAVGEFSGPYASLGRSQREGAQLAIDQINDEGGVDGRELELLTRDSEADPTTAVRRLESLVTDEGIPVTLTGISSASAAAMQSVAPDNDIVVVHPSGSDPTLTGENCNRNTFRVCRDTYMEANLQAPYLAENIDSALYFGSDYNWGRNTAPIYQERLEKAGVEWLGAHFPPFGADDFSQYFGYIDETKPDVLICYIASVPAITSQLGEFGYLDGDMVTAGAGNWNDYALLEAIGEQYGTGRLSPSWFTRSVDSDRMRSFLDAYQSRWDALPRRHAESAFSGVHMLASAIKSAGSTEAADLIPEIEGIEWETPIGTRRIRPADHQALMPMFQCESGWKDGGPVKNILSEASAEDIAPTPRCDLTGNAG